MPKPACSSSLSKIVARPDFAGKMCFGLSIDAEALGFLVSPVDASFPTSTWRTDVGSGTLFFIPIHSFCNSVPAQVSLLHPSWVAMGKVQSYCNCILALHAAAELPLLSWQDQHSALTCPSHKYSACNSSPCGLCRSVCHLSLIIVLSPYVLSQMHVRVLACPAASNRRSSYAAGVWGSGVAKKQVICIVVKWAAVPQ